MERARGFVRVVCEIVLTIGLNFELWIDYQNYASYSAASDPLRQMLLS